MRGIQTATRPESSRSTTRQAKPAVVAGGAGGSHPHEPAPGIVTQNRLKRPCVSSQSPSNGRMWRGNSGVESICAAGPPVGSLRHEHDRAGCSGHSGSPAEDSPHGGGGEFRGVHSRLRGSWWRTHRPYSARGLERLVLESARTCWAYLPPCSWIGQMEDRDAG
jgi:hypothetical protein